MHGPADADPFPPTWGGGSGAAVHYAPVAWPSEPANPADCTTSCGGWKPYGRFQNAIDDPRVQDPSNGGTAPQNYVNIASSCVDKSLPSIYYALQQGAAADGSEDVIMFRWRVEQIANNYATGPSPGNYSATNPWSSALWTVLFDLDGSGYRSLAAHLNGSSGSPSEPIDMLAGIYGKIPTQSIDYLNDPTHIYLLGHNPTAFVSDSSSRLLNFQNSLTPVDSWPSGASAIRWDYGTTRAELVSTNACTEYFVDYQIPVAMLDASSYGGPKITRSTPLSMLFCTANSLNNPFQKDCAINKSWAADASKPAPFGDYISFDQTDAYAQPIISSVTAKAPSSCPGSYTLQAQVQDTLALDSNGNVIPSVKAVSFWYWYDSDGDGTANEAGGTWIKAADATLKSGTLNQWVASWDAATLPKGQYLVGVQAVDDRTLVDDGMTPAAQDNRSFSYVTGDSSNRIYVNGSSYATLPDHSPTMTPSSSENWYGNPAVTGVQTALVGMAINACGLAPTIVKSVSDTNPTAGSTVDFTLTVSNQLSTTLSLSNLSDPLPAGFTFASMQGGTLSPSTSPTAGASGTLSWGFSPAVSLAPGTSATLVFRANVSSVVGNYNNTASATTDFGSLDSDPVAINVGAARLSLSKTPTSDGATPRYSAVPGDTIVYVLTYSNDSTVMASDVVISDTLPDGLTYVSCTGGCSNSGGTLSWSLGDIAAGSGPYSVRYTATVTSPYPGTAAVPNINTASIGGSNTSVATASASVYISTPRPALSLTKTANKSLVQPGVTSNDSTGTPANRVTFTLAYSNTGNATATNVVLSDPLPSGFTFVSASGASSTPAVDSNGTVTWNIASLAAGASGSVTVIAQVSNSYTGTANPANNVAAIQSTEVTTPVTDTASVGVTQSGLQCNSYYPTTSTANVGTLSGTEVGWSNTLSNPQRTLTTTAPSGVGAVIQRLIPSNSAPVPEIEVARFYQDPVSSQLITFDGSSTLSGYIYYTKSNTLGGATNANLTLYVRAYDDDPSTGTQTLLGTASYTDNGTPNPPVNLSSVAPSGSLQKGHRLLIVVSVVMAQNKSTTMELTVDSAQSYVQICAPPPANLVLEKSVDQASVNVSGTGRTLTYTLNYANTSTATAATHATISDTLPSGVSYASCSVAGSTSFNQCSFSGGVVTFSNSSGATVGVGASGYVTVTVNVADDLSGISSLTNSATIQSDQTSAAPTGGATATTYVTGTSSNPSGAPKLVVSKLASQTLLKIGESVSYTLTVVNAGDKTASPVTLSDDFPEQSYFSYTGCSTATGSCSESPVGTLAWSIGSLSPGQSATLTYTMSVGSGAPAGVTTLDNTAYVVDGEDCTGTSCPSNTVTVSITTNPQLSLVKSATDVNGGTLEPGDTLNYTLTVSNSGSGAANSVVVLDPLPANTTYIGGLTASMGSGSFDAVNNRVRFDVGTLAAGAHATLGFQATIADKLPSGDTTITNTATVSAANASAQNASAQSIATATPTLTVLKSGPESLPYPAATLTAAADASSTLLLNTTTGLTIGQLVKVAGGSALGITAVSSNSITLDGAVTASAGASVVASATYSLSYQNTGTADASNVVLTDTLPAGLLYQSSSPTATSAPAVGSSGSVSWQLGTLAPDDQGSVQITVFPAAAGSHTNSATLSADNATSSQSDVQTIAGGLSSSKVTSTPYLNPGDIATYVISITNSSTTGFTGVTVTDILPTGFTYRSGTTYLNGSASVAADPAGDLTQPVWTVDVPASGSYTIKFSADVSADAGSATYQNGVELTKSGAGITPFDPLSTEAEDVTVLGTDVALIDGVVYLDNDRNGSFDALTDTVLSNVLVSIAPGSGSAYTAYTDANGYFSRVLPAGDYTVTVDTSGVSGMVLTSGSVNPASVTLPGGGHVRDDTGFVTPSATPDLSIQKTHTGDFTQGQTGATYTLSVRNAAGSATTSGTVTVTDTLPSGLTATAISGSGWSCVLASLSCTRTDALTAGSTYPLITVTVNVASDAASSLVNLASVSGGGDDTPTNNSASDTTTIVGVTDVYTTLSVPPQVAAGDLIGVSVTFGNQGGLVADGVAYALSLPAGLSGVSCVGATCDYNALTGAVTISGLPDALSPGQSAHLSLFYQAPASGPLTAQSQISTTSSESSTANNVASGSTTLSSSVADPTIWLDVPATANPGATVLVQVSATNLGAVTASDTSITLSLPSGLSGVLCTAATCSYDNTSGTVTVSGLATTLSPAEIQNFTLSYLAPASGTVTVQAAIAASNDANTGNNTASGSTLIDASTMADVATSLSPPATATAGSTVAVPVRFTNLGPAPATGVSYTLTLPAGLTGVSCPAGVTCALSGTTLTVTGLPTTLNPGELAAFTLSYTAPASGTVSITANVSLSGPGESNLANNSATALTTVTIQPDLAISLAGLPTTATVGTPYSGSFSCSNVGASDATSGTSCAVSGLPAGLSVTGCTVSPSAANWTAGQNVAVGATVTCTVAGTPTTTGDATVNGTTNADGDTVVANNTASLLISIGSATATGSISGSVWYDVNHNGVRDSGESGRSDWTVQLYKGSSLISSVVTDSGGYYSFDGLTPGDDYTVRFIDPSGTVIGGGPVPVNNGGSNGGTPGSGELTGIRVTAGGSVVDQSLPLDPSGVVYDSVARVPIANAIVTLLGPGGSNLSAYLVGGSNTVTTSATGAYAFYLLSGAPAGTYTLVVSAAGYHTSTLIPASTTSVAVAQVTAISGVPQAGQDTTYYLSFPRPVTDMTNNNIPLDPNTQGPARIPTLSEWAMFMLGLLLIGAAARRQRR